jgi:hypothetical protein
MRLIMSATAVVLCLLVLPLHALAQERREPGTEKPHRFLDATNIALTAIETGALLADGITTQRALKKYPEFFREADPIARPFVNRGWPGQIVGGTLFIGADVGLRYWLHKNGHHRIERILPMVLTTYGSVCAIQNHREMQRFERWYSVSITMPLGR